MRRAFVILGGVSVVTAATGLTLWLHLASHDHEHEHDSAHCGVCQQFLAGQKSLHVASQPTLHVDDTSWTTCPVAHRENLPTFCRDGFENRPPPPFTF